MPTSQQYEIVKQQVKSFESIGCHARLEIQSMAFGGAPKILITNWMGVKTYRFSEPDWNVVSMQLSELYKTMKGNG